VNYVANKAKQNFVRAGWFALHRSVCELGVEIDVGSMPELNGTALIYSVAYCELMKPLLKITGIKLENSSEDGDLVAQSIWKCLLAIKKQSIIGCDAFLRYSINGLCAAYFDWNEKPAHLKNMPISNQDPLKAAKIGWSLIVGYSQNSKNSNELFWGLALLGWVNTIYSNTRKCPYCFRWSYPGSKLCIKHSQSKSLNLSKGTAYIQYRRGRNTFKHAATSKIHIKHEFSLADPLQWRGILASYLFFNMPDQQDADDLQNVLDMCPLVFRALKGKRFLNLSIKERFEYLRRYLNPLEFLPIALAEQVFLAERILSIELRLAGRPTGTKSVETKKLVQDCIGMANQGMRKAEISRKLKVSKSTISNWIIRYTEVRLAFE
jgi:hypothetical protein